MVNPRTELVRAQQHLDVAPERRDRQRLSSRVRRAPGHDAGHHARHRPPSAPPASRRPPGFRSAAFSASPSSAASRRSSYARAARPPGTPGPRPVRRRKARDRRSGGTPSPRADRLSGSSRTFSAIRSACCCMNSLFMKNSRWSGTLVAKRCSAEIVAAGKSNSCRNWIELVAAHLAVDRAPRRRRRQRFGRPADLRVERARHEQHRIADLLGAQPRPVGAPVHSGCRRPSRFTGSSAALS
jgi:hypothetical protein